MSTMELSEVHRMLETTMNSLSIIFNLFLLYLIRFHSMRQMSTYKRMLTIDASLDLILAIVCLLAQPAYFTGDGFLVSISNGRFAELYPSLNGCFLIAFCFTFLLNLIWIPSQFAYRCISICRPKDNHTLIWVVACIFVVWSIIGMAVIYPVHDPPTEFQPVAAEVLHSIDWPVRANGSLSGVRLTDIRLICWTLFWVVSAITSIGIVAVCEWKIFHYLQSFGHTYTSQTRQMHREFHRALMAMAICPLFTTTAPTFYFVACMGLSLNPGPVSAFVSSAFSSIILLNPLTTVLFMRCYREAVLSPVRRLLRKRNIVASYVTAYAIRQECR